MALYEDETQTPWDKELARYGNESPMSAGTITNETTGQVTPVDRTLPVQPMNQGQPQQTGMPPGGDVNQFLDWVIKNKIGFNPFTMNPTTEALNTWNNNESDYFNKAFSGTGITSSNMTPEALRHWNEQRREGMAALIQEAQYKRANAVDQLNMYKDLWKERQKPTSLTTVNKDTGKEEYLNELGQKTGIEKPQGSDRGQYVGTTLDENGNPAAVVFNPKSGEFKTQPFPEGKAPMPKQMSEALKTKISAVNQTQDLVDGLAEKWLQLKIESRGDAISAFLSGKTGSNPTAKTYYDEREAFLGQLSRSIAAERGVLTNQDIDRIKKALPAIGINPTNVDTGEEGAIKWKDIYTVIENAKKRAWEEAGMSYNSVVEPRSKMADKFFGDKKDKNKAGSTQDTPKKSKFKVLEVK